MEGSRIAIWRLLTVIPLLGLALTAALLPRGAPQNALASRLQAPPTSGTIVGSPPPGGTTPTASPTSQPTVQPTVPPKTQPTCSAGGETGCATSMPPPQATGTPTATPTATPSPTSPPMGASARLVAEATIHKASGNTAVVSWHMAYNLGIRGFRIYAGKTQVSQATIRARRNPVYHARVRWIAGARYTLLILFKHGASRRIPLSIR